MTKYDKDLRSRGKVVDDFENELKAVPKTKPASTKAAKVRSKSGPSFTATDISNVILLKDDTTRKIFGILLVCFALFSAAALISFALYWKTDLSILQGEEMLDNFEIKNWMGELGAGFGYAVMYKGFGLLSLLIP